MFAKHLPPSAGLPRVRVLGPAAAAALAGRVQMVVATPGADDWPAGPFDAIAGPAAPGQVAALAQRLRPGGRLILANAGEPEALLAALTATGLIHCLVEPQGPLCLYRGEWPPAGSTVERHQALAGAGEPAAPSNPPLPITSYPDLRAPYIFLLVTRVPNKPAWKLAAGERVIWRAATLAPAPGAPPVLLGFSSRSP